MNLTKDSINKDPIKQFSLWLDDAKKLDLKDPNAMNLASSTKDGVPSSRMLLLKSFDKKGFVFYTNYDSRKSNEILQNPLVALNFFWDALERQVRVEGKIEKADKVISDKYFNSRSRLSQLSAHASKQSQVIKNYDELTDKLNSLEEKFKDQDIPRPDHWGGFIVIPETIEFWQGHDGRLHDRLKFKKEHSGWIINRLSP
ncbi:MAG: pyridoxamine 5'-phosphate oxidase [Gammaproteobacteria bacterium]|jgi:pyridoxamine 5'-phosphate oxidase|nr:pyridoxamine 5'-phosphate oxidase [Gammaproteobacteria bacterium]MBT7603128.1 pyridoxamine 5'-phosphate oxidase [Gammaproteobacteria bacterium]